MTRISALLAATLLLPIAACTDQSPEPAVIEARDGWARASAPNQRMAAAYLTIANSGNADARLTSVSTNAATAASMHSSMTVDGIATMRPIENGLTIPAGGETLFEPGGDHFMLVGLQKPLIAGQTFTLTLRFADGQEIPAVIEIVAPGAR